jgi:hypothetical protein
MSKTNGKNGKSDKIELRVSINEAWWRGFAAGQGKKWQEVRKNIRKQAIESVDESGAEVVVSFVDSLSYDEEYDVMFLVPGTEEEASTELTKMYGIRKPAGVCRRVGATLRDLQSTTA